MTRPLRVGIAGLGTVGGGVLQLLRDNADLLAARGGRRDRRSPPSRRATATATAASRWPALRWYDDPVALAADPEVDVVVELIGGADGTARGAGRGGDRRTASRWSPPTRRCSPCTARRSPRGRGGRRGAGLRGGGGRRHPGRSRRCARAWPATASTRVVRHPQRHLQLHPDRDARAAAASSPRCSAEAQKLGYAEADPELRRRRHRRRAQAGDPGGARLRRPGRVRRRACRGHPPHLARSTSPSPTSSATASSCSASRGATERRDRAARASLHGAAGRRRSPQVDGRVQRRGRRGRLRRPGDAGGPRRRRRPDRLGGGRRPGRHRPRPAAAGLGRRRPTRLSRRCRRCRWSAIAAPTTCG